MISILKWIGRITVALLLVMLAGIVLFARQQAINTIVPQRRPITRTPADFNIPIWEDITYQTPDDLTLHAYFIPPDPATNGSTLIYVHGYTGNRDSMLPQVKAMTQLGYGALLIELRAHGESGGDVTTFGITELNDIQGAITFLESRPEVNADQLGIVGQSLGCIVSIPAAAQLPQIDVVVGQSCMSDFRENLNSTIRNIVGLPPFPFAPLITFFGSRTAGIDVDDVKPISAIDDISPRPVLLLHGEQDQLFDVQNAYDLFEAANEPKQLHVIDGVGHAPFYDNASAEIDAQISIFLQMYLPN